MTQTARRPIATAAKILSFDLEPPCAREEGASGGRGGLRACVRSVSRIMRRSSSETAREEHGEAQILTSESRAPEVTGRRDGH